MTFALGLFALLAPRLALRALGLEERGGRLDAPASVRGPIAGFPLGLGLIALLFYDQPTLQLALGTAWLLAAFGRLVSVLSDAAGVRGWALLALDLALALAALAPVWGLVPR